MSQSLYRKYRPQQFSEVVGQESVVKVLKKALKTGKIVHAYLFCGPKGTGKTSTARILAKAINCLSKPEKEATFVTEPCNTCDNCKAITENRFLDLIEIDAASNRGIDEIRELKEKVNYSPNQGKYKIYIIDEVHMLTNEASNALLKTLEEPPEGVIFILCTTEMHKILPTVISRCQRYDFKRASVVDLKKRLGQILEKEGIVMDAMAVADVAKMSSGGYRDAEALLGKIVSLSENKKITVDDLHSLLGLSDQVFISRIITAVTQKSLKDAFTVVRELQDKGVDLTDFNKKLVDYFRKLVLLKEGMDAEALDLTEEEYGQLKKEGEPLSSMILVQWIEILDLAKKESKYATIPSLPLEIAFFKIIKGLGNPTTTVIVEKKSVAVVKEIKAMPKEPVQPISEMKEVKKAVNPESEKKEAVNTQASTAKIETKTEETMVEDKDALSQIVLRWQDFLVRVKPRNHSISAILKGCKPKSVRGNVLWLEFFYAFHKERMETLKSKLIVEEELSLMMGKKMAIKCVLGTKGKETVEVKKSVEARQEDLLAAASEIFGTKIN